jgi:hypothetical protein
MNFIGLLESATIIYQQSCSPYLTASYRSLPRLNISG